MRVFTVWGDMEWVVGKNHREINQKRFSLVFLYKINEEISGDIGPVTVFLEIK